MAKPVRFRVVDSEAGTMLFHLLARRLDGVDPERAKALVKAGAVYMGHLRVRVPTTRVATGERISVYPDGDRVEPVEPDELRFVHRDPAFVVIDKPAGVAVTQTRASARGTLTEALRRRLEHEGVLRPYVGVVHRLDRNATGLVLFTVRSIANRSLHEQFVQHEIARRYRVLVHGHTPASFRCDAPLRELSSGRVVVATTADPHARIAGTRFTTRAPLHSRAETSLLDVDLETGRTHQIRVHASHLGYPVVGDAKYGPDREGPLHLHAWALDFTHPLDGTHLELRAPLPAWAHTADQTADDRG